MQKFPPNIAQTKRWKHLHGNPQDTNGRLEQLRAIIGNAYSEPMQNTTNSLFKAALSGGVLQFNPLKGQGHVGIREHLVSNIFSPSTSTLTKLQ
jgi:hypothetical protein